MQFGWSSFGFSDKIRAIGIQFHPEISHTERGTDILANFAIKVCGAKADWQMDNFTEKEIIRIRNLVGDKAQVVCSLFGSAGEGQLANRLVDWSCVRRR